MSKKPISFGKISFNFTKGSLDEKKDESTSGFGTFGRTPIQEQRDIEEIADDLESQHVHQVTYLLSVPPLWATSGQLGIIVLGSWSGNG